MTKLINIEKGKKDYFITILLLLYAFISAIFMKYPGLYMDAVNPDYLALHIASPDLVPAWIYSDNILESVITGQIYHYPIMNSLYGIATPAYLFWIWSRIFGASVVSLRCIHIIYGCGVVYVFYKLIKSLFEKKTGTIAAITTIFAFSPMMIFVWRTQYYLQLFPMLTFLPALTILINEMKKEDINYKKILLVNILFGFSAAGYFVYSFYYIPVFIFEVVFFIRKKQRAVKCILNGVGGFFIGWVPFVYGHISIICISGLEGWIEQLKGLSTAYGLGSNTENRIVHVIKIISNLFSGSKELAVIFGQENHREIGYIFLAIFFLSSIYTIYVILRNRNSFINNILTKVYILLLSMFLIHILFGILIGSSLDYQHYVMLCVIMYVIASINILLILSRMPILKKMSSYAVIITIIIISSGIIFSNYKVIKTTQGENYYSNVINEVGDFLKITSDNSVMIFPQWGYWMGASISSGGEKRIWNDIDENTIISKLNASDFDMVYILVNDQKAQDISERITSETMYNTVEEIIPFFDEKGIEEVKILKIVNN